METYRVIGLMSGTSLDGLDIAYCKFDGGKKGWHFSIKEAQTLKYDAVWLKKLKNAHTLSARELAHLHNEYGKYLGVCVEQFIKKHNIVKIDFVASHGHTIFHQPDKHFTFQLGNGAAIAAEIKLPVVSDFRSLDVALGGQGAPLVPMGDKLLFGEYTYCLNLGGFANISFDQKGKRVAHDICPANIILNHIASSVSKDFDEDGKIAAKGKVNKEVLQKLNSLAYYKKPAPKSLGREWLEEEFLPHIDKWKASAEDKMATVTEHIAIQISTAIKDKKTSLLVTGGGAFNVYLIKKIKQLLPQAKVIVPAKELVNYKEALVFALLGVLRWRGEENTLKSVTGAIKNSSGGSIYII